MSVKNGLIAATIKSAFKIYLVPARQARDASSSAAEGWSQLVAEARQEHEASKLADERQEIGAGPDTAASPGTIGFEAAMGAETPPSPTLVESGDSAVEVRPNPAISPAHATAGVTGHLPSEVQHRLARNDPIRA